MKYNFEEAKSRKNQGAHKWENMYAKKDNLDPRVLPMSVADMEFESAPEIYQGLADFLKTKPILGYTSPTDDFYQAIIIWYKKRHGIDLKKEWILNTPGVVNALKIAVNSLTEKGDGVIIFKPVYYPFMKTIQDNFRKEVNVPLLENEGDYTIDFEKFEEEAKKKENKLVIFCSPHNPVGRVWTREELEEVSRIVIENDLYIVSDEVWSDLINPNFKFTSMLNLNPDLNKRLIVTSAISKSFNLAGLKISNILIPDKKVREKFENVGVSMGLIGANIIGCKATKLAYNKGEKWLDQVLEVIYSNQEFVVEFFKTNFPQVKTKVSQGTYLQWIDFRELGLDKDQLDQLMVDGNVFSNPGHSFGEEGLGFQRINTALPRKNLEYIMETLLSELSKRKA